MAQRPIFEDQTGTSTRRAPPAATGALDRGQGARGAIRGWLMALFALVVVMIAVGGLTRLTGSGLSITDWRPLVGAIPPLSAADWAREFDAYRQIDQYRLVNQGMTLGEFQVIYWWEWGHRQLGRLIGLVWGVGFVGFLAARAIPPGWTPRLLLLGALGGTQGAIGWWMVYSGLQDGMVSVASYRLATHLGLAFVILGLIAWYVFLLGRSEPDLMQARRSGEPRLFGLSTGLLHLTFLQIVLGALVAGIDAGRAFPDWPLMAGGFLPPNPFSIEPLWRNFFENAGLVQFIHRMTGYAVFAFALVVWWRSRGSAHPVTRRAFDWVMGAMLVQVELGIAAVVTMAHVHVAITHQIGAVILWVLILRARHLARYPVLTSIRGTTA